MSHHGLLSGTNKSAGKIQFATSPRHLAGGGDPRHVTQALRAAGWENHSAPDYPHVVLVSPDYRYSLVLEPEPQPYAAWWRVRGDADDAHWYAEFGGNTPVEVIAGFTDSLIRPAPGEELDVWQALTAAGWTYHRDERGGEQALHPDRTVQVRTSRHSDDISCHWRLEAALPTGLGGHVRVWHASFDERVPHHLIAGFVTALASTEPVQRGMYDIPHHHLVTQELTGPQAEQLVEAHQARLDAARTAAREARRTVPALHTQRSPATTAPPAATARRGR